MSRVSEMSPEALESIALRFTRPSSWALAYGRLHSAEGLLVATDGMAFFCARNPKIAARPDSSYDFLRFDPFRGRCRPKSASRIGGMDWFSSLAAATEALEEKDSAFFAEVVRRWRERNEAMNHNFCPHCGQPIDITADGLLEEPEGPPERIYSGGVFDIDDAVFRFCLLRRCVKAAEECGGATEALLCREEEVEGGSRVASPVLVLRGDDFHVVLAPLTPIQARKEISLDSHLLGRLDPAPNNEST